MPRPAKEDRHRIALGLFLIGIILLCFWWYELHMKTVCELSGGKWERIGAADHCNPKATDGGKACTDTSQCQGACLVESITATAGTCSEYRYFPECVNGLYNGTVSELCWNNL